MGGGGGYKGTICGLNGAYIGSILDNFSTKTLRCCLIKSKSHCTASTVDILRGLKVNRTHLVQACAVKTFKVRRLLQIYAFTSARRTRLLSKMNVAVKYLFDDMEEDSAKTAGQAKKVRQDPHKSLGKVNETRSKSEKVSAKYMR